MLKLKKELGTVFTMSGISLEQQVPPPPSHQRCPTSLYPAIGAPGSLF